jgi:nucleoside-diphosphate-sugar epimerase
VTPEAVYAGARVLVTGGLGFIGSNLAIELVRLGARVRVVDALIPQHGGNPFNVEPIRDQIEIFLEDLRDPEVALARVAAQDFVFHLAGQVSHGDSMRDPQLDLAVNCGATINLVEACRQANPGARLVYTSTRQVYGIPRALPVHESHPTVPIDVNGINKLAGEYYHLLYQRTYGLHSAVLRLTNTYGPRQQIRSDRQSFIGIMIRQALRGDTLQVFGSGRQLRDFNHVDDVVRALLLAGATESCFGRVLNLGAPRHYSLLEFVAELHAACPLRHQLVPFPDDRKIIDIGDYYGDYSAFAEATGWQPAIALAEGLASTLAHYREHAEVYWR